MRLRINIYRDRVTLRAVWSVLCMVACLIAFARYGWQEAGFVLVVWLWTTPSPQFKKEKKAFRETFPTFIRWFATLRKNRKSKSNGQE